MLGFIIAGMALVTIVFEFPAGIIADRWSRKGVLMIGFGAMAISTVIGAIAAVPWHYALNQFFWGLFYACYSGTYESMVYDTLIEEGQNKRFEYWFGKVGRYDSIGLMISSVLGGLVAAAWDIRMAYWLTLSAIGLAAWCLAKFREPRVHSQNESTQLLAHIGSTVRGLLRSPLLITYCLVSIAVGATVRLYFEFDQIWLIAYGLPVVLFGVTNAGILSSIGLRSVIADRIKLERHKLLVLLMLAAVVLSLLMAVPQRWLVVGVLVSIAIVLMLAVLVIDSLIHHELESRYRTGASSLLSAINHLLFVLMSIGFGLVAGGLSITWASLLPVVSLFAALLLSIKTWRQHSVALTHSEVQ